MKTNILKTIPLTILLSVPMANAQESILEKSIQEDQRVCAQLIISADKQPPENITILGPYPCNQKYILELPQYKPIQVIAASRYKEKLEQEIQHIYATEKKRTIIPILRDQKKKRVN